jgi:hypothetical protein
MTATLEVPVADFERLAHGWLIVDGLRHPNHNRDSGVELNVVPPDLVALVSAPCLSNDCENGRLWDDPEMSHPGCLGTGSLLLTVTTECSTCGGDTNDDLHPCAKSQRDGQHCNCSMTQDVCHWCGLEWLGDGEVRCPDCSMRPCLAKRWNGDPSPDGPHGPHFFTYGSAGEYQGYCSGRDGTRSVRVRLTGQPLPIVSEHDYMPNTHAIEVTDQGLVLLHFAADDGAMYVSDIDLGSDPAALIGRRAFACKVVTGDPASITEREAGLRNELSRLGDEAGL